MASGESRRFSISSSILPSALQSRRGSIVSSSAKSAQDKESRAQALDEIHTTASRSNELTAFPPPPPSATDDRPISSHQSSLGSLYNRLKATVSSNNDIHSSPPRPASGGRKDIPNASRPPPSKTDDQPAEVIARSPSLARAQLFSPVPGSPAESTKIDASGAARTASIASRAAAVDTTDFGNANPESGSRLSLPDTHDEQRESQGAPLAVPASSATKTPRISGSRSDIEVDSDGLLKQRQEDLVIVTQSKLDVRSPSKPVLTLVTSSNETSPTSQAKGQGRTSTQHQREVSQTSTALPQIRHNVGSESETSSIRKTKPNYQECSVTVPDTISQLKHVASNSSRLSSDNNAKRNPRGPSASFVHQMRRKILSRDFWMKDENAKVCFSCGDAFSTFRRKHHCRLCGQIFCSSCTNLVSGKAFGQASKLRVCKTCETMMNGDDSSDYTEDEDVSIHPQVKQIRFSEIPPAAEATTGKRIADSPSDTEKPMTPSSSSSAFRRSRDGKRRSIQLERMPTLSRPASSRSLKPASIRPRSSSQKPRRSRTQHMRSLGVAVDDGVPFQAGIIESSEAPLPNFHTDSVIDPDLAPFLSGDDTSDDDTPNIAAALDVDFSDQPTTFPGSIFGALKRARSYGPGKQPGDSGKNHKDADNMSIASSRNGRLRKHLGSRSVSVASFSLQSASPRPPKADSFTASSENYHKPHSTFHFDPSMSQSEDETGQKSNRPDAGLNRAGLKYVKDLLRQFLLDYKIKHVKQWERALVPILLRCAENVDPNLRRSDDLDIRHYVKLKKAPGGSPSDTFYVSGVVFSKNVALKSMPRHIENPRILLISFPLVYARHQQHFMSLEPVIAQEREYLRNLVGRIKALRPSVLLVQRDVAGLALQFLSEANIVVAYNVKFSVLAAISRCTQTRIVASPERLNTSYNALGRCGSFDVKTYVSQKVKKTLMSFSGCQKDLGCTIVLRGESREILSKLKWITDFMCYVTYNLKLETCLMRDEFAALPSVLDDKSTPEAQFTSEAEAQVSRPSTATEQDKQAPEVAHSRKTNSRHNKIPGTGNSPSGPHDALVRELAQRRLSASPFVKLAEPWLLLRGRDCEQQMARIRGLQQSSRSSISPEIDEKASSVHKFEIVKPESARRATTKSSRLAQDVLHAMREAEYEKASYLYGNLKRNWERYTGGASDFLDPRSHQRIMVSFSIISTPTQDACDGPDLVGLEFYQERDVDENLEPDVPLGEYVERLCNQAHSPCTAGRCDRKMIDHHRQYVHGDGQVSIYLQHYPARFKGMENNILMWSTCRICQHETQITTMSPNTWKYSFGKYLELSFWASSLRPRTGYCEHNIHHDHIRWFGFKNLAIRVQYDKINILEIAAPRTTVIWLVEKDLRLKNLVYSKAEERITRFMASVRQRIKSINVDSIAPEKVEDCRLEIERLSRKASEESDTVVQTLQTEYMTSKYYELIPMNRAARLVQEKVAEWDTAFADFEQDYFPSERDIRRLAALQIKKAFLDRESTDSDEKSSAEQHHTLDGENPEKAISRRRAGQEGGDIPLTTLSSLPTDSTLKEIGSMPAESLFKETPPQDLKEHEQLVQTLDLAIPSPIVAASNAAAIGEAGTDSITLMSQTRRPSVADPPKPQPLEPELVAKVEQMQAAAQEAGQAEPTTPERAVAADLEQPDEADIVVAAMPPMLRSKTQPELQMWPDPDTPIKPTASPDAAQPSIPLPSFTSRIPVAPSTLLADRMGMSAMRTGKGALQSMIPRAVKKNESKVSALAKHFEEMSREFEKERLRERRQRAARNRQSRAYPMIVSRPIVEVFRDAHEAVSERDEHYRALHPDNHMQSDYFDDDPFRQVGHETQQNEEQNDEVDEAHEDPPLAGVLALEHTDDDRTVASYPTSDVEEAMMSDGDQPSHDDNRGSTDYSDKGIPSLFEQQQDDTIELPKHEKTSLLKMLTSFWSERSASGWSPLDYPLAPTDHIFADSDIIVREDEPSSLVAFALASEDYDMKLKRFRERAMTVDIVQAQASTTAEVPKSQADIEVERVMLGKTATHMKYQFQAGSARMLVKIFYAESFDAIRRKCGVADRFVESLSRSIKWDSKGGKTKSLFLKTLDERFVLKSLSAIETQAFLKFAPDYFDYMSKCLFHSLPSALAKMLGFYQVVIKNPATGTDLNYFLQVMENVFYEGPQPTRMFDLKGSMRNRRIQPTGEADEVLLDENLLDYISAHPIYVRAHSNSLLASSIQNDTLFCSKQNVMDYSLIAALYDEPRAELCVGIIDYIRTYTWDKKIESWIKDRGKHKPTVMSPKDYRTRFRKSIPRYFPLVPGPWQMSSGGPGRLEADLELGAGRGEETVEETVEEEEEGEDGVDALEGQNE